VSGSSTSRRAVRKAETQTALRDAALELYAEYGYDGVTTEDIAERAGVSARTFFRYYPTKESVLLGGQLDWYRWFAEVYPRQPVGMTDIEAVCRTFVELAPDIMQRRERLLAYERAVASSPTLRGHVQDYQSVDRENIAKVIATRRGLDEPDESCRLLASVGLCAFRAALDSWLADRQTADFRRAVTDHFRVLETALATDRGQPRS
jgi:AcrR family transcriptional regulator